MTRVPFGSADAPKRGPTAAVLACGCRMFLSAVFSLAPMLGHAQIPPNDYFPLEDGKYWVYAGRSVDNFPKAGLTVEYRTSDSVVSMPSPVALGEETKVFQNTFRSFHGDFERLRGGSETSYDVGFYHHEMAEALECLPLRDLPADEALRRQWEIHKQLEEAQGNTKYERYHPSTRGDRF